MTLTVLDCTLRDGGYYNNWNFDYDTVCTYLKSIGQAGIDIAELGFRDFPREGFVGPYAYTSDEILAALPIPDNLEVAVMVDAKTLLTYKDGATIGVDRLFAPKGTSMVDVVRIAVHFKDAELCHELVERICDLGYKVCLNIMQSGNRTDEELSSLARLVEHWGLVSILYFADSLGNMDESNVARVITALKKGWKGPVGIHAHNNRGQGVSNTLAAIDLGVEIVDATILGMGRGAGNAQMEILLMEMEKRSIGHYASNELFDLVLGHFEPLKKKYNWGPNLLYHYAADKNIHPTYIQELISDVRYSNEDIINSLKYFKTMPSTSFSRPLLAAARGGNYDNDILAGEWDATNFCKGRDVMILGAGPSIREHALGIHNFIKKYQPLVISLNIHREIDSDNIDYYVAAQETRFIVEAVKHSNITKPLVLPNKRVPREVLEQFGVKDIKDYDLKIKPGKVEFRATGCVLPAPLSVGYAISLATIGKAARIFMVGFDGFSGDDPRQEEMIATLNLLCEQIENIELISLTPTTYPLNRGSIYAPY